MRKRRKLYKILKNRAETISILPGKYAGNKTHKIFGRLDCKSGMRMISKENLVFFLTWNDAIAAGYRPCKNCKPRRSDKYPQQEKIEAALLAKPHIAIWKLGPPPDNKQPNRAWYACINWEEKGFLHCQATISDCFLYEQTFAVAITFGKICNLPIIKHSAADFTVVWTPRRNSTPKNRKMLKELQNDKKVMKLRSAFL